MPVVTATVSANADDGYEFIGGWYADGDSPGRWSAGRYGGDFLYGAVRVQVAVPQGTTPDSAVLRLYKIGSQVGTPIIHLHADDADSSAAISSGALPSSRALTTAGNTYPLTAGQWGAAGWLELDVTQIVAEVLARPGWASGQYMTLIMSGDASSPGSDYVEFEDFIASGAHHPELVVTYSAGGAQVDVTGGAVSLAASGGAGSASGGTDVSGGVAAVLLGGGAGAVSGGAEVSGGASAPALTGYAGSSDAGAGVNVAGGAAAAALFGHAGVAAAGAAVTGAQRLFALTAQQGAASSGVTISGDSTSLTVTGSAGATEVGAGAAVDGGAHALSIQSHAGDAIVGVDAQGGTLSHTESGQTGEVSAGVAVSGVASAPSMSGASGAHSVGVDASGGGIGLSLVLHQGAATTDVASEADITGEATELSLSGQPGGMTRGLSLTGGWRELSLSGHASAPLRGMAIQGGAGELLATGRGRAAVIGVAPAGGYADVAAVLSPGLAAVGAAASGGAGALTISGGAGETVGRGIVVDGLAGPFPLTGHSGHFVTGELSAWMMAGAAVENELRAAFCLSHDRAADIAVTASWRARLRINE